MYELFVRDKYFTKVAQIDNYQSLDAVMRFNAPGSWVLELPSNTEAAQYLIKPKAGIVVEKDGKTLFSGPVTGINRKWDKDGDLLTVNGYDDLILLQRNLAYPVPLGPPYTSQDYDIRKGKAETIMKAYLNANIGVNARSDRKIEITTEADAGLGTIITGRARFQTLLELFTSLALIGGDLGFRIVQVNNALQFQVYQPSNKTNIAVFSPGLGNLLGFEYSTEDPEVNYTIVGGIGEGKSRTILEKGDYYSITNYGRIEEFLDRRDIDDNTELAQAMDEELSSKSRKIKLSITPIDTDSLSFGTDYNVGDKVSIILPNSNNSDVDKISDVVREIKITLNQGGVLVNPTIGTPESMGSKLLSFAEKMSKMKFRMSKLERR
ncbi:siphovirus ReqiPepy6 Gp37-like family protein [Gottfriedia acidiceleris]|uniref:siphovirus ReqiPepy6 Gp37-like family protein n=1 Tax=Gottfriedia acidiceleris TaxID=371036 RepID=UPI002F262582